MGEEEKDEIMDDEEEGTPKEEPAASQPSKIIKILLYAAGGILIVVLMIGISYLVSKNVQESSYARSQDIVAAPPPEPLQTFELPSLSNTTADLEPHFIKMQVSLGYDMSPSLNTELSKRKDEMLHIINILLKGKKFEELNSIDSAVSLSEEIKAHINIRLISGKIKEVYFKEFIVN